MKKDIGVSVTKRDLKNNLLHREFQLYNNRIALGDGVTNYRDHPKGYAIQYNKKMDHVVCGCKTPGMKHHHEARYVITTPGSYRSRNYLDVGVGSIRKLPKKRVRKVYLPETSEMGVGSTDLTPYFRRNKHQTYDHYSHGKTYSKGVGAFIEPASGYVVSEKLSPIVQSLSGYNKLSRYKSLTRSDLRKRTKTLRDTEIGSNLIHSQIASASVQVEKSKHEYKTAYAGNSTVNQLVTATTQVEVENSREYKSKNSLRRTPTKAGIAHQTGKSKSPTLSKASKTSSKTPVEVRTEKILSSDTILQVHNLEVNSETKFVTSKEPSDKNNVNSVKTANEEQKKNSNIEEDASNMSKGSTVKNLSSLKSTSILKRRFDALRRTLCKKEDSKKVVKIPSRHTPVSITSSQKSHTSHQTVVSRTSSKKSQPFLQKPVSRSSSQKSHPSLHKPVSRSSSQKSHTSRHMVVSRTSSRKSQQSRMDVAIASDPPSLVARSYSELFIEPNKVSFKHSGKKSLNVEKQESLHDESSSRFKKQESLHDESSSRFNTLDSDVSQGVKGMFKLWGKKFNLEGNPDGEGIYSPSYIKPKTKAIEENFEEKPAPKAKEKKRFFFFRSKPKETKKPNEKEKVQLNDNFASKQGITTGRCEVKSGFAIKMEGHTRQKSIMIKKEPEKRRESPGELLRQDWLMKYSTNPNESCYSVKLRWNNGTFVTSSSTVGGTEKAYDTDDLLKSASELSITTYGKSSRFVPKTQHNVNYMQLYQAWMIPRLYRTMAPTRSENYEGNIDVAFLDKQWFIDKSKAFADQLELILHTKNITKFNRKISSEYITIDIPKDFFSDSSTGDDNTPRRPIRMSEEEVYNIVEYETPSEVMRKYKNTILKVDHSVQGSLVTKSMEAIIIEPPQREKKYKSKHKDIETQQSPIYDPNKVVGVRLISRNELRDTRKLNARCMEYESNHYHGNFHPCHSGRKCECADSYSQEYCSGNIWTGSGNNWVPMDLFSWCISDHKFKYCAFKESRRSISYEDCTKSCPNIHEDFVTPTFMSTCNIKSSFSPYRDVQTEKNTQDNLKSVKFLPQIRSIKERTRDMARFIPKDSLEVLKKRKIYASRKNWASTESDKKDRKEGTSKKRVSLEFDNITEEILTTITSHSTSKRSTSKRTLPSDKTSDSYSLVSDPETISTHSRKSSKQSSLTVAAKKFKKFSYSSTPRLSPKQSNPKVSCSCLKMGVMGILSIESPHNDYSSADCLRSSVSKISIHKDSDMKKFSVHTAQSRQNNPVLSLVKSESESLPVVVIESFKSGASKFSKAEETSKASLDNTESKCEKLIIPIKKHSSHSIVLNEQNTKADCKNVEDSLALNCEIVKPKIKDELNNSIAYNNPDEKLNEMINNIHDSFALKYNSVKEVQKQSNDALISNQNDRLASNSETESDAKQYGRADVIQNTNNCITSNSETESDAKKYERNDMIQNITHLITSNSETESDAKKYDRIDLIQNTNHLITSHSETEREAKKHERTNSLQTTNHFITSNSETESDAKKIQSNIFLISNDQTKEEVFTDIDDVMNSQSAKETKKRNSDHSVNSKTQRIIKTTLEPKEFALESRHSKHLSNKSILSKTKFNPQKTSAISLDKKTSEEVSIDVPIKKIESLEQNVFNENHTSRRMSDCNASMKTQHTDVVHINSHEKITVKVNNSISSTEEIAQSKSKAGHETVTSFAEIKHEVYHSKGSLSNGDALTTFTDNGTSKTYNIRKISKDNNKLQSKSETSIANIIEIDFKLKVIDGDQSTEVHIGNEGKMENKINSKQASQDVLVMNENEQNYPVSEYITKDGNGKKDINIKIMIKNFKSKTNSGISSKPHKTSKHYVDFSNKISEKFKTVAASDMYSTHKATVNLTNSHKSEESIKFNNEISHHLSDIIMLSNVNKSEASVEMSDTKSVTETRKKKMSIFGKITSRTKERFSKSHGKLSKCSESDTVASEKDVGIENNIRVSSKTSTKSKSIRSIYRKAVGHKPTKKIDDNMMKLSEEFPLDYASQSKYQERKELLKKVFQTANCLGKRKTKSRVRKLKSILKSILTSDSDTDLSLVRQDLIKDFTDASLSVEKSSYTSLSSVLNKIDDNQKCCEKRTKDTSSTDYPSEKDDVTDSNEKSPKGCACSTIADRLNKCGGLAAGGCCCSKPLGKHEETSCNFTKEERQSQQLFRTVSLVDAETQKSLKCVSKLTNVSKHFYSNHQSIAQVAIVDKEFNNIIMTESYESPAKLVSHLEETERAAKDNEEAVVKTVVNENGNITENDNISITEVNNKEVINIQENKGLMEETNKEELNVTHKMKTAARRASTDSKKIVITIDNIKKKTEESKIANKDDSKALGLKSNRIKPCEFKMLDRNTKLGISDDDQVIFLDSESTKPNSRIKERHKHRKWENTNESPHVFGPDVLQMYETKKAVLQIYAEKKRTANGEKFVANLPVFMVNKEREIYEHYGDLVKYAYCSVRKNVM